MTAPGDSRGESPRVALDVTALYSGATGVARYVRELAGALADRDLTLAPFAVGRGNAAGTDLSVRRLRVPLRIVHRSWAAIAAPRAEWIVRGCDLVHSPDLVPPPTRLPLVMTVHDLDALGRPELHPPRAALIQRAQLEAARDRASVVLASPTTSAALREHGVSAERIRVTTFGVTPLPAPDLSLVPPVPYLLVVGSIDLRKGQDILVRALARSRRADIQLVLAGPDGWGAAEVRAAIERSDWAGSVRVTGRITDAQLAGLYQRSVAVCVPSRTEGFGIPIIEAAALGVPVVASDIPAARALAPAVSAFAAPEGERAWAEVLDGVIGNAEIAETARGRGPAFAREFTWERVATTTVAAYESALASST